jgi:hypothetical protein
MKLMPRHTVRNTCILTSATLLATGHAFAEKRPSAERFQAIVACQKISEAQQRLQCFDASVAQLEQATARDEIVVMDRTQIKETRKSLFGLSLPSIAIFGSDRSENGQEKEGVSFIDGKIARAAPGPSGKWFFVLDDGARWAQTELTRMRSPKAGDSIRIRKTALGGYMANINDRPAIRVKREN